MVEMTHLEYRVVMLQRVVTIVVAEGTFRFPDVWRHLAFYGEFDIRHQSVSAQGVLGHFQLVADEQ